MVKGRRKDFDNPLSTLPHWGSQVNMLESTCVRDCGQRGGMLQVRGKRGASSYLTRGRG